MGPLVFTPDYKELVWGGEKLRTVYGKNIPSDHTGESWEIACRDNGQSIVANGQFKGLTLEELLLKHGKEVIGKAYVEGDKFPLLLKIIDAKADLSVQVHPDDAYSAINENGELGKTEAWVVLDAEPGAKLVIGLVAGTTKASFIKALDEGRLTSILNQIEIKTGDVIDIPAGLVHAIGTGVLLAEIQQNSDTTYRVYDWDRVGLDGKGRDLHIAQALDTIDFEGVHSTECIPGTTVEEDGYSHTKYISNIYFALERLGVQKAYASTRDYNFEMYMVVEGGGILKGDFDEIHLKKGDSLIIPNAVERYTFQGEMQLLKSYVPQ